MQAAGSVAPALLALERVGKIFRNGTVALEPLDLAVAEGAFLGILGPSGCGKSTLLRLIAGLAPPSSGRIRWRDGAPAGHIGFVFQEPTLMPWATVWDNVYLPLRLQGRSHAAVGAGIADALTALGLGGFEQVYPRELSGGMRMRVSIARALVTQPRLLLMDEPFAALDELTRFKLNEDLLELWRRHDCTIVFVTHSVFESVFLSERVVVMTPRPGRIAEEIAVDLPYPRTAALRTDAAYVERCGAVSRCLAAASR